MTSSERPRRPDPSPLRTAALLLIAGGLVYASLWLVVGYTAQGTRFSSADAEVWRAIVSAQGVLWGACLWLSHEDWRDALDRGKAAFFYLAIVALALAMAGVMPRVFRDTVGVMPRFCLVGVGINRFATIFTALGTAVGALLATPIGVAFADLRRPQLSLADLLKVRGRLRRAVTNVSVILVVAVVSTSWLSKALNSIEKDAFPNQLVFTYGLYFTVVLLLVYLPAGAELHRAAVQLVDQKHPMPEFEKDVSELREAFLKELGATGGDAIQSAVATLSPIVTAIVAIALGK